MGAQRWRRNDRAIQIIRVIDLKLRGRLELSAARHAANRAPHIKAATKITRLIQPIMVNGAVFPT